MTARFADKRALVTGATRGIGAAIARALIAEGAHVTITGRCARPGWWDDAERCEFLAVDFLDIDQTQGFLNTVGAAVFDLVVNNAGGFHAAPVEEMETQAWESLIRTNLTLPMLITGAVAGKMRGNSCGRIVNIGSIAGFVSRAGLSAYSSSKAGLAGLTRASALDLAASGILVNCVCPAYTDTDMLTNLSEEARDKLLKNVPLGRFGQPEDIADAVLFLLSPTNTFITGQTLIVDGGVTLQ
jgi:NAD(P)-dependent dehydrogenase (short-subunit alcohol dehydrogenase family)